MATVATGKTRHSVSNVGAIDVKSVSAVVRRSFQVDGSRQEAQPRCWISAHDCHEGAARGADAARALRPLQRQRRAATCWQAHGYISCGYIPCPRARSAVTRSACCAELVPRQGPLSAAALQWRRARRHRLAVGKPLVPSQRTTAELTLLVVLQLEAGRCEGNWLAARSKHNAQQHNHGKIATWSQSKGRGWRWCLMRPVPCA